MTKTHNYTTNLIWTGNLGSGTKDYKAYERNHTIQVTGKPLLACSSDPSFRGDALKYNPEELFLASLSSCHMLWYLHLCSVNQIVVQRYGDQATGIMQESANGSGRFTEVILNPEVVVQEEGMISLATSLHEEANKMCFIANSVNFPVSHKPVVKAEI